MLRNNQRLLAKSYDRRLYPDHPPDYALLTQHTRNVVEACAALAAVAGPNAFSSCGLCLTDLPRFSHTLRLTGWIHDLGKANSHFQEMVRLQPEISQLLYHEVVSGLLLWLGPCAGDATFRECLTPMEQDFLCSVWAGLGHHRRFSEQTQPTQSAQMTVYLTHPDFRVMLCDMAESLNLAHPPICTRDLTIGRSHRDMGDLTAINAIDNLVEDFQDREADFGDQSVRRFLALVKAFAMAADVAASAIAPLRGKDIRSIADFVTEQLSVGLTVSDLTQLANRWAWNNCQCESSLGDRSNLPPGFVVRPFQTQVAASPSLLTLADAGCGSGKSYAAYLWGMQWCQRKAGQGFEHFRMFVCLPTTGTTTEHFKDYALESGLHTSLVHSRSKIDLRSIAEAYRPRSTTQESTTDQYSTDIVSEESDRIEALLLWGTPLVVTTADTVLGIMVNARKSLYALPAVLQSAVVFDEVHAFDDELFGHLVVFLKNFPGLPVLLMSASLPEHRIKAIEAVRPDLLRVPGPEGFESLPRYSLILSQDNDTIWRQVEECARSGGKVLWVRNRVDWANETYEEALRHFPSVYVDVYHSRLRYKDRSHRHRQVIDRFKQDGEATILVSTQVAEMSLNLSADLLITDIAPIPSLIQRLGRLNRRVTPDHPGNPKPAIISLLPLAEPALPYEHHDLVAAETWIGALLALDISLSQRDLTEQFAMVNPAKNFDYTEAEERACFFGVPGKSGLWRTVRGRTRSEGYTVSVVLEEDIRTFREPEGRSHPDRDWLRNHEVAIPIRPKEMARWERIGGMRVAPASAVKYDYDESSRKGTGARWREN